LGGLLESWPKKKSEFVQWKAGWSKVTRKLGLTKKPGQKKKSEKQLKKRKKDYEKTENGRRINKRGRKNG